MPFDGRRVFALESRRAQDIETLILRYGGAPFVAPSVKERALDDQHAAFDFLSQLESGRFDMVILMTGVGVQFLHQVIATRFPAQRLSQALAQVTLLCRGPKPIQPLRTLGLTPTVVIPEPNSWKEVVAGVAARGERRISLHEYGRPNPAFNQALEALGAQVTSLFLYRWDLPEDLQPLRAAARKIASGECDVLLFTSSIQLDHLLQVAAAEGVEPQLRHALLHQVTIASVGPVMTDALLNFGVTPHVIPDRPKMGALVKAASDFF